MKLNVAFLLILTMGSRPRHSPVSSIVCTPKILVMSYWTVCGIFRLQKIF